MSHDELIKTLVECKLIITDSGGLQEECSFFNKKCLVCRKTTERPEALGTTSELVDEPQKLSKIFYANIWQKNKIFDSPFGNGNSSKRICDIFETLI